MTKDEKKIYAQRPDIKEKVFNKYPVSKDEKHCRAEKATMNWMRNAYALRLFRQTGIQIK